MDSQNNRLTFLKNSRLNEVMIHSIENVCFASSASKGKGLFLIFDDCNWTSKNCHLLPQGKVAFIGRLLLFEGLLYRLLCLKLIVVIGRWPRSCSYVHLKLESKCLADNTFLKLHETVKTMFFNLCHMSLIETYGGFACVFTNEKLFLNENF